MGSGVGRVFRRRSWGIADLVPQPSDRVPDRFGVRFVGESVVIESGEVHDPLWSTVCVVDATLDRGWDEAVEFGLEEDDREFDLGGGLFDIHRLAHAIGDAVDESSHRVAAGDAFDDGAKRWRVSEHHPAAGGRHDPACGDVQRGGTSEAVSTQQHAGVWRRTAEGFGGERDRGLGDG